MSKLIIPTPLRKFTEEQSTFESTGKTVKEIIQDLVSRYDGLKKHILDDQGNIRSFVRIYVGDNDIQSLDQESTPVQNHEIVSIIPAIAGGLE
ncbi:MAG: molybdopterin synthase sulfur carrier subunit [Flavobacteriales bacterium]|jgi:molybdopterin synthase sulfur carrier subunit